MQMRRKIKGDKWTFKIVTLKEIAKQADNIEAAGLCVPYEKTIYIREDSVEYGVVAHELFHAFFSYLHLSDTNNIALDDAEEICASLIAAEGEELVKMAKKLTKDLKKLQAQGEE